MTELTLNGLRDFIANTAIGGWWRKTLSELEQANGIDPKQSAEPAAEPERLTSAEHAKVMDFAAGVGTFSEVEELLKRVPWRMAADLKLGHCRSLERIREEMMARAREAKLQRFEIRERGREARTDKYRRLADDRNRC